MAQNGSGNRSNNKSAWIVGGSIVLAGLLVSLTLVLLAGGGDDASAPSSSPSTEQPSQSPSRSPKPHRSPQPSPSPSTSPSPSPSPQVDETQLIRATVEKQAARDRPGEVQHVGKVDFYTDNVGCPPTGQASSTMVRFTTDPKVAIYIFCRGNVRWKYMDGPIYGE